MIDVEGLSMKKNIALLVLIIISVISIAGWFDAARQANSNYKVMMSEAKIIRQLKGIDEK